MCQQPAEYWYVCYSRILSTKKELCFLNKVTEVSGGEGVRNFIFYNRHAGDKQAWLSVK